VGGGASEIDAGDEKRKREYDQKAGKTAKNGPTMAPPKVTGGKSYKWTRSKGGKTRTQEETVVPRGTDRGKDCNSENEERGFLFRGATQPPLP